LLKMISGFIWGSLYLQTLNIVYPMIAHTVFNIIVYRRSISCKST
jgi:membrane protease YdiL (CAAX protease family)